VESTISVLHADSDSMAEHARGVDLRCTKAISKASSALLQIPFLADVNGLYRRDYSRYSGFGDEKLELQRLGKLVCDSIDIFFIKCFRIFSITKKG
jgi:hypothetical protein